MAQTSNGFLQQDTSVTTSLLLQFYVLIFGIHRFMMGDTTNGILMLLTLGGCGIWALIDFIRILTGDMSR